MVRRILTGPWEAVKRRLPDRQIYHRSDGQVRYFAVTTGMQVGAIGVACAITVWVVVSSVNMMLHGVQMNARAREEAQLVARYEQQLEELRAAEAAALAYVESRTDAFDRTAGEFQLRHETLRRLIDFAEDLQADDGVQSPALEDGRILMAAVEADPEPRAALIPAADIEIGEAPPERRVAALMASQDAALARAEDAAEARLEGLRAVLRLTGLKIEDVLAEGGEDGEGGPFIPLSESLLVQDGAAAGDPFASRIARITARLTESEALEDALRAAPLGVPVNAPHRHTSPYGPRIDPFTRRPAFHAGKDFAAFRRAPIVASAPGRVVYAGWRAGYGRMVEIDHGYGFRTRYGHLHTIDVRRGDEVTAGQQLGGMGSTGRSTATHLHYEVWFNGNHYDPERFLRAGRYVH